VRIDEPLGIGEGQRAPKLRFENAEDGGVGADAQRKRKNDHESKPGILAQHSKAVAKIA
jgi:hypothetical protein